MNWPVQAKFELANRFTTMGLTPMRPPTVGQAPSFRYDASLFGPDLGNFQMPKCHNPDLVMLLADRFVRNDVALAKWAEPAKKCVDFAEGRQYTAAQLAAREREGLPSMVFNKIAPLIRLVLGYHRNNRLDIRYMPGDDLAATQAVAEILTKLNKQISNLNQEPYVDTEVMMDGLLTGRGYYDSRLNFEKNDFGEIGCVAKDPFTIRVAADADTYDPYHWPEVQEARWWSIEEIEFSFGRNVAALVYPLIGGHGYRGGHNSIVEFQEEITPWRNFGGGTESGDLLTMEGFIANSIDPYRKNVRVLETQWMVRVLQRCIVNLETGDREPIPDHLGPEDTMKILAWCAEQYAMKGMECPLRVEWRPMRRVRWTVMVGDLVVYDQWSPYETYTITPYFPWFRRGRTRGMVEDLLGPQEEVNRRRNAQIDIVERTAHSGWMYHERSLRDSEKLKLQRYGAAAGIHVEWRGSHEMKPEKIKPGEAPTAMERLEERSTNDLKEIGGINDSALGNLDRVQSGRAIEARQRQSVLGIETYMDNGRRSKLLLGNKRLEMVQNHYTEQRIFRIAGGQGKFEQFDINRRIATGEIVNNVTIGKYTVTVDDTPLSSTFLTAQYEELVEMAEKGILPVPLIQDIAIDLSSLPQKELLKQRMNALLKAQGFLTADEILAMIQQGVMPPPAMVPPMGPAGEASAGPAPGGKKSGKEKKEKQPVGGASEAPVGQSADPSGAMVGQGNFY